MLSRPIGPIKKNRWIAGILSMLRSDMEQPCLAVVSSWHRDLAPENSDFWRMDKESWERVTSVTAPVIWAFRSFLLDSGGSFRQHLRRHLLGSFARTDCSKGFWFWIRQHPTCLSPHSAMIYIDPLHCRSLRMSQDVSGSSWENVHPNASHYKVGFTLVHNLTSKNWQTDYLSWSVCYLQVERPAQRTL